MRTAFVRAPRFSRSGRFAMSGRKWGIDRPPSGETWNLSNFRKQNAGFGISLSAMKLLWIFGAARPLPAAADSGLGSGFRISVVLSERTLIDRPRMDSEKLLQPAINPFPSGSPGRRWPFAFVNPAATFADLPRQHSRHQIEINGRRLEKGQEGNWDRENYSFGAGI